MLKRSAGSGSMQEKTEPMLCQLLRGSLSDSSGTVQCFSFCSWQMVVWWLQTPQLNVTVFMFGPHVVPELSISEWKKTTTFSRLSYRPRIFFRGNDSSYKTWHVAFMSMTEKLRHHGCMFSSLPDKEMAVPTWLSLPSPDRLCLPQISQLSTRVPERSPFPLEQASRWSYPGIGGSPHSSNLSDRSEGRVTCNKR